MICAASGCLQHPSPVQGICPVIEQPDLPGAHGWCLFARCAAAVNHAETYLIACSPGQGCMAAMHASWVIILAAFSTLAVARAAHSPYDSCTCPKNTTGSYDLGQIQFLCPYPNIPTLVAPVSGRALPNNQTDLCNSNHCCEYAIGRKPQLAPNAATPAGDAVLLVGTWVLTAGCGAAGLMLYMLQPFLVRRFEHADIRRRLLTLFASLLGAIGFSLGSDLLLWSTAINQVRHHAQGLLCCILVRLCTCIYVSCSSFPKA